MKNYASFLMVLMLSGCATTPSLYSWGTYPQQTYLMYVSPEKATATMQIAQLEQDIETAKAKGLAVPPGLYGHLGLLYLQTQNMQKAGQYFELEKNTYPESSILMDRLLQKRNTTKESASL